MEPQTIATARVLERLAEFLDSLAKLLTDREAVAALNSSKLLCEQLAGRCEFFATTLREEVN